MKVVHIIESTATGVLSMVVALANSQASTHRVTVIYSARPETPADIGVRFAPGVSVMRLQMRTTTERLKALGALRRTLVRLRPQAVFLHSSMAGFIGRLAMIGGFRECGVFYVPHCISFMRRDIGSMKRFLFVCLERMAMVRRATYVACSASERDQIRKWLRRADLRLVENGVALEPGVERPSRSDGQGGVVVTTGQVRAQKDPASFARLAARVRGFNGAKFVWVGDGVDEASKRELVDAGVEVLGWMDRKDVFAQLQGADIYLSTSLWEGMPVSVLEAMAAGLPVVVSNCDGNRDVVSHGITGYVYTSADEGEVYLLRLLSDHVLRRDMGLRAMQDVQTRFSLTRYLAQMDSLMAQHGDARVVP